MLPRPLHPLRLPLSPVDQTRVTENGIEEGRGDGPHGPSSSEPSQEYSIESLDQVEGAGEVVDGYPSVEAQDIEESKGDCRNVVVCQCWILRVVTSFN